MNIINKILITTSVFLLFLLAGGPGSEVEKSEESLYEMLQGNWVLDGVSYSGINRIYVVVSNDTLIEKYIYAKRVENKVNKLFFQMLGILSRVR